MQSPQTIEELLRAVAAEGGKLDGLGFADDEIVKQARSLGLIDVDPGNAWTLVDTVRLTPTQRMVMGLPPIVQKPSVLTLTLHAVATAFARIFGNRRVLP
ncbi:hypothetical protein CO666_03840 [Rhizobium chutanense]|uniref:Uncharacterized protein n=1 Tax=Rhizobium chutanense TaxID=2035448 RepID=A0A2A6JHB4_9HYPH|nr:hypothetical protein [Rhizobium chutanense]PDT05744.1 hypothetical protein CO666_03840 [Rhizobium chutanense]